MSAMELYHCDYCKKPITDYVLTPANTDLKLHLHCAELYQKQTEEDKKVINLTTLIRNMWKER